MNDVKKIKLSDLIAQADTLKKRKKEKKDLFVKSLNGSITVIEPEKSLCLDALDMDSDGNNYMVYECTVEPNLKDASLQKALGAVTPLDVVEILFKPGEIVAISQEIAELAGYGGNSVKAVEELKN